MAGMGAGYDLSVATYSPDGRVFQVEYAAKAVDNSGTVVGFRCKDGVILGVEKLLVSPMLVSGTNKRVYAITPRIAMAVAGLMADARQLVSRAREEAQVYEESYGEPIPGKLLAQRLSYFVHIFTINWSVRPFGASLLLASLEDGTKEPVLYSVEPSGACFEYYGCALGKGRQAAKTAIESLKVQDMTCQEALFHMAKVLHKVHDENKDKVYVLEVAWICPQSNNEYQVVPPQEMGKVEEEAKKALQDMEDE